MAYVQGQSRDQAERFPVSLDELIGADHVCRVIAAFVNSLDFKDLGFMRARPKATGRPPYDPADLLMLYLYGYLNRVRSSRRLEQECHRNVEVMWLLNRLTPDHKTIAEFRRNNTEALKRAGAAFVRLCTRVGLVRGQWVAVDGTKFQAVASKKSIITVQQLAEQEAQLQQRVAQYLQELDEGDEQCADVQHDPQALRQALEHLQRQQAAMRALGRDKQVGTEPEAVVLKGHGPGYKVQTAVDAEHAIIVAHEVHAQAGDNNSLQRMGEAARQALGGGTFDLVADAGYINGEQTHALQEAGIEVHVPVKRALNNQGDGQLFDRVCFSYDPQRDAYTCPAGKVLQRKQINRREKNIIYAAQARDCAACVVKGQCTHSEQRYVSRHLYEQALQRMHEQATPEPCG